MAGVALQRLLPLCTLILESTLGISDVWFNQPVVMTNELVRDNVA